MARPEHEVANFPLRFLVQSRFAHDAAAAHIRSLELKLRFDEREDHSVGSYQLERIRQDQSQGNKGNVDDAKVDCIGNISAAKKTGVEFFADDYAWVAPDFPGQLAVPNINCVDFPRAALQEAIGESTGRCADIERRESIYLNAEVRQGT